MDNQVKFPIDAVVTWVNGNDPEYQKKISHLVHSHSFDLCGPVYGCKIFPFGKSLC